METAYLESPCYQCLVLVSSPSLLVGMTYVDETSDVFVVVVATAADAVVAMKSLCE